MKKQRPPVTVEITSFSTKGNGLGEIESALNQKTCIEVPFTLPGDTVIASLKSNYKRRKKGSIDAILQPSTQRISPRCVHFGVCGGCRWQHLDYENQLKYKQESIAKIFSTLLPDGVEIGKIIPSPEIWGYRNKMEFSFSCDKENRKYLGLVMEGGRGKVFNLTECHLPPSWFAKTVQAVRNWWNHTDLDAYHPHSNSGSLRTLTLRSGFRTNDRLAMLTVSGNPEHAINKKDLEDFVSVLKENATPTEEGARLSIFLRIHQAEKGMTTNFYEMLLHGPDHIREVLNIQVDAMEPEVPLTFHVSPSAFFQPNIRQAEILYSKALQMAEIPTDGVVYDLYCGTGTLGICAASKAKEVIGIELSPESALDARLNASLNNLENITIISGAVRHVLRELKDQGKLKRADLVVIDPPRPGLDPEAFSQIVSLRAKNILYISCNPLTQAANVADFIQAGYEVKAIQPVDQFPHTYHLENIVVLSAKS